MEEAEECCCICGDKTKTVCVTCAELLLIPGLSILDIASDGINAYELSGYDTSWMGFLSTSYNYTDECYNSSNHFVHFNDSLYFNDSEQFSDLIQNEACGPKSDPIWATLSAMLIFAPGWLMAAYLLLSSAFGPQEGEGAANEPDTDEIAQEKKETRWLIGLGLFCFPFLLVGTQVAHIFGKFKNLTMRYCNVFEGFEAFGEAAPQLLLNCFVILHRGKITTFQGISMFLSLVTVIRRVLTFDFIPEIHEKNSKDLRDDENSRPINLYTYFSGPICNKIKCTCGLKCCCRECIIDKPTCKMFLKQMLRLLFVVSCYFLSLYIRLYGILIIAVFQRWLTVLTIAIHVLAISCVAKFKYKADVSSCLLLSVINILIQSNGGVDDINATSFEILGITSIICFLNYGLFFGITLAMIHIACDSGNIGIFDIPFKEHLLQYKNDTCYIRFGDLEECTPLKVGLFFLFLTLFHLFWLWVGKHYEFLPKTVSELEQADEDIQVRVERESIAGEVVELRKHVKNSIEPSN